jgi:hypothetical protein
MINNNLTEHTDNDGNIYYTHTVNSDIKIPAAAASFFDEFQAQDLLDVMMLDTTERERRGLWSIINQKNELEVVYLQEGKDKKRYSVPHKNYSYELPLFVTYEKNVLKVHRPFDDDLNALMTVKAMLDTLYTKYDLNIFDYFKSITKVNNTINQQ